MPNQIAKVTIPAFVISFNNIQFIEKPTNVVGKVIDVPCRNDNIYDNEDRWAVPIKDNGIFTGFDFLLKQGQDLAQPTFDSFTCFLLRDKNYNDWYIYGTKDDFFISCNTCCGGASPIPMPAFNGTDVNSPASFIISPSQAGLSNGVNYYSIIGLPELTTGLNYLPIGGFNNVAITPPPPTGFADITSLLSFLNSNATFGILTWTSNDALSLIATSSIPVNETNYNISISVIAI